MIYNIEGLRVYGKSIAARGSSWHVSGPGLLFDCGYNLNKTKINAIFITHLHTDHYFELYRILLGLNMVVKVYIPKGTKSLLQQWLNLCTQLTTNNEEKINEMCVLVEVEDSDKIAINKEYSITVFETFHDMPSVGYILNRTTNKIRPEYRNAVNKKKLREEGKLTVKTTKPILAYTGDTDERVFENKTLLKAISCNKMSVIMECTFLTESVLAAKHRHICFATVAPIIAKFPKVEFWLTHFSARYTKEEIREFFRGKSIHLLV